MCNKPTSNLHDHVKTKQTTCETHHQTHIKNLTVRPAAFQWSAYCCRADSCHTCQWMLSHGSSIASPPMDAPVHHPFQGV